MESVASRVYSFREAGEEIKTDVAICIFFPVQTFYNDLCSTGY